jgi:hypothetical protein
VRVKQFEDMIEEHPDYITLRDHMSRTVAGEGRRINLMGSLWRLLQTARRSDLPDRVEEPEPVQKAQIGPPQQETTTDGEDGVASESPEDPT